MALLLVLLVLRVVYYQAFVAAEVETKTTTRTVPHLRLSESRRDPPPPASDDDDAAKT